MRGMLGSGMEKDLMGSGGYTRHDGSLPCAMISGCIALSKTRKL